MLAVGQETPVSATVPLVVNYNKDVVVSGADAVEVLSDVNLSCSSAANPEATYSWKKGGADVGEGETLTISGLKFHLLLYQFLYLEWYWHQRNRTYQQQMLMKKVSPWSAQPRHPRHLHSCGLAGKMFSKEPKLHPTDSLTPQRSPSHPIKPFPSFHMQCTPAPLRWEQNHKVPISRLKSSKKNQVQQE